MGVNEERLAVGTAQFGSSYGISGKSSPDQAAIQTIIQNAHELGVRTIDTAYAYTSSEEMLGKELVTYKNAFEVISKYPPTKQFGDNAVEEICKRSLGRLNIEKFEAYLLHDFQDYLNNATVWEDFQEIKAKNLSKYIGFSIYNEADLEMILKQQIPFDAVQLPFSVFDNRFEKYFDQLKERSIEIHARSVFLQGLAYFSPDDLPPVLKGAAKAIELLHTLSKERCLSINEICLGYVLLDERIDKVVLGIREPEQLRENVNGLSQITDVKNIYDKLCRVCIEDPGIIDPRKWQINKAGV